MITERWVDETHDAIYNIIVS